MWGGSPIGETPMIGGCVPGGGAAAWGGVAIGVGAGAPRTCAGGGDSGIGIGIWSGIACVCGAGCSNGCACPGGCVCGDPRGAPFGDPEADAPRSSCPDVIVVVPRGPGGTPPALDRTLPC